MNQLDQEQLCAFFQRSRYDIIQVRQKDGWGPLWTFPPCDIHGARKAARMLLKMNGGEPLRVRHARRARLRDRHQTATDVVVVTELPERVQGVFSLENATVLRVEVYLQDDALAALEAEIVRSSVR